MKKNRKSIIFLLLLFVFFLTIGGTIAYFSSRDTFVNEFDAANYVIEVEETFESPDNWTPGTTTPKEVIATNRSDMPVAVRIKLTPSWIDKNGNPLSLYDSDDNKVALINFTSGYKSKWAYIDGYYYYLDPLEVDESTTSLLESVTFNPNVKVSNSNNCETVNGLTTCRTTYSDYAGGKYTLQVDIETCQYDKYEDIWGVWVYPNEDGHLISQTFDEEYVFEKRVHKDNFEKIITVNDREVPPGAIDSWDCSTNRNSSIMCWYKDGDNDSKYELYIGQDGGVKASSNSSYLFHNFRNIELIDLSYFDTTGVKNMAHMFDNTGYDSSTFRIIGLDKFDTSQVTDMSIMFYRVGYSAQTFDIGDISGWDTSKVTNMRQMFQFTGLDTPTFDIGDLSNWDTSQVIDMTQMFNLAGGDSTTWNSIGTLKIYANNIESMFDGCKGAKATLNMYSNPTNYSYALAYASTKPGSGITVNYSSSTTNIDNIIATKSGNSNVVKGSILD